MPRGMRRTRALNRHALREVQASATEAERAAALRLRADVIKDIIVGVIIEHDAATLEELDVVADSDAFLSK